MGADSYFSLPTWHNSDFIINNFKLYVYARNSTQICKTSPKKTNLTGSEINISSSRIRKSFSSGFIDYAMLDHKVLKYIIANKVY